MNILLDTKVADLLKNYPQLEEKLLELSPVFSKLKNPILRNTVARVTSLQQAAALADISPTLLIQELRSAAGLSDFSTENGNFEENENLTTPDWMNEERIVLIFDACPIINSGQSPMQEILKQSSNLQVGDILQLVTPFKPVPIIDILRNKGFRLWSKDNNTFITR